MKSAASALVSRLNTPGATKGVVDLWTITPVGGSPIYWTGGAYTTPNRPLTVPGQTFQGATVPTLTFQTSGSTGVPIIKRPAIKSTAGVKTGSFTLTLLCTPSVLYGSIPLTLACANGALKGATVQLDRLYCAYPEDVSVPPLLKVFMGYVADQQVSSLQVALTVKDLRERLNILIPKQVYQPQCAHILGDAGCGINLSSWRVTGTVTGTTSTTTSVVATLAGTSGGTAVNDLPDLWWSPGIINFITGSNQGVMATLSHDFLSRTTHVWTLTVPIPLAAAPASGDTFTLTPSCDRTLPTCVNKFANNGHYGGQIMVPPAQTIA